MNSKELKDWIEELIEGNNLKRFYNSKKIWRPVRAAIMKRDNYECQWCKQQGKYSEGQTVHHIKHLKEFPELALVPSNLITLCNKCHNKAHPEKAFKQKVNRDLKEFKERW